MTLPLDPVLAEGARRGEGADEALRHHLLEGLLRRLASLPEAGFVLRGGLATRAWLAPRGLPRPTRDLDWVGDFPFDLEEAARRLQAVVEAPADDGITLDPQSFRARGIWLDTAFPGVRAVVRATAGGAPREITADVGFGDPLVPDAVRLPYPALVGAPVVRICRPETQVGWKLHGLAERGAAFRPKDLADLWRITEAVPLEADALPEAIEVAFHSRGFTREQAIGVLELPHWATKTARVRWDGRGLPPLEGVLACVRAALAPALAAL